MWSQFQFLKHSLGNQKKLLAISSTVLFIQAFLLLIFPLPVRYALDLALTPGAKADDITTLSSMSFTHLQILIFACAGSLLIGLLMTTFEFLDERFASKSILRLVSSTRIQLLNDLLSRQFAYMETKIKVDILGRLSGDTQNLELFVSTTLVVLFRSLPSLIFAVVAMFIINSKFATLMLLLIPAFYASITVISKKIKNHEKDYRSKTNAFEQESLQALSALSLLKSLQGEKETLSLLEARQSQINISFFDSKFFTALLNSIFSGSRHLIRAMILLLGGYAILQGTLTIGTLFAFVSYLEALNRPIGEIANFISRYGKASASLERIQELVIEQQLYPEIDGTKPLLQLEKNNDNFLEFKNLSFGYAKDRLLLKDLNLKLTGPSLLAIVGPSGVGKSSFIKLLNRLNSPVSGEIFLQGTDIANIQLRDLRRHICLISQDPFFLAGTVRQNLLLALGAQVPDKNIWAALEKVNAAEFVAALPQGLETKIGESGIQLSGGQSKRLSLARGFLRAESASIFIFDEPTSGLDPASANHVMRALQDLSLKKPLVLFSTHRVEEFILADQVLFFSKNQSPLLATHQVLNSDNLEYQKMITKQVVEVEI